VEKSFFKVLSFLSKIGQEDRLPSQGHQCKSIFEIQQIYFIFIHFSNQSSAVFVLLSNDFFDQNFSYRKTTFA